MVWIRLTVFVRLEVVLTTAVAVIVTVETVVVVPAVVVTTQAHAVLRLLGATPDSCEGVASRFAGPLYAYVVVVPPVAVWVLGTKSVIFAPPA